MEIVWVIYTFIMLPLFIRKEKQIGVSKALPYKLALSGVFCVVGFWGLVHHSVMIHNGLIVLGLLLSLIGDYYLAFINTDEIKFIKGILSFSGAQLCYILMLISINGVGLGEIIITVVFVSVVVVGINKIKLPIGKVELLLFGYMGLVTFMGVKAVLMTFTDSSKYLNQPMFSLGAVLFLLSDIFLGIGQFIAPKKIFSYLVSVCYFVGQLLIASSIVIL